MALARHYIDAAERKKSTRPAMNKASPYRSPARTPTLGRVSEPKDGSRIPGHSSGALEHARARDRARGTGKSSPVPATTRVEATRTTVPDGGERSRARAGAEKKSARPTMSKASPYAPPGGARAARGRHSAAKGKPPAKASSAVKKAKARDRVFLKWAKNGTSPAKAPALAVEKARARDRADYLYQHMLALDVKSEETKAVADTGAEDVGEEDETFYDALEFLPGEAASDDVVVEDVSDEEDDEELRDLRSPCRNRVPAHGWMEPLEPGCSSRSAAVSEPAAF